LIDAVASGSKLDHAWYPLRNQSGWRWKSPKRDPKNSLDEIQILMTSAELLLSRRLTQSCQVRSSILRRVQIDLAGADAGCADDKAPVGCPSSREFF